MQPQLDKIEQFEAWKEAVNSGEAEVGTAKRLAVKNRADTTVAKLKADGPFIAKPGVKGLKEGATLYRLYPENDESGGIQVFESIRTFVNDAYRDGRGAKP